MAEFNPDTLSDEDHEELMTAMLDGTLESQLEYTEEKDDTIVEQEVTDQEDTDLDLDTEDDTDTNEEPDGELEDTEEFEDEDEEEDTLVETDSEESNDSGEEEDEDTDEVEESENGSADEEDQEETETSEVDADLTTEQAAGIDYKAFYDAVTGTEFVVNGRKTHGFTDPKKIIQSQQMAGGFSEKMAGFKKYRPYMTPLQERGMLEDPEKFNLAMQLIDGDQEALKQHMKNLDIDPLDIEMDEINYTNTNTLATNEQLILEESLEDARLAGVEPEMREVLGKDWDQESFNDYLEDPQVRTDLMDHMQSGAYEYVQDRIAEIKRTDVSGQFRGMKSIDQYRAAAKDIQQEMAVQEATRISNEARQATKAQTVQVEKERIAKTRKETEYKAKASTQVDKAAERRKRASSVSKRKPKAIQKAEKFDPAKLDDKDFDDLMTAMINGDIK